ncbi:hypothetical protein RclHR1_00070064 [Rhizophagus clarus]|uniref:F-box domain-containing protein n=1 Tax=Rhizophagus clarus TaxID=94130 RepID=A0A2Z6SK09_9GLOM|nr:hypothetical protein RclHR1_00070064 [Rhizophagus clarus]GES74362.1 hypothetical protein GLOIN_2v1782082 [Rhizophagus clarus]
MTKLNSDCLYLVFNELNDKKSLYYCLLVNKEWCNLAVSILWKKYTHYNYRKSFSNIILSCLPPSSKQLLSDNNIKLPSTILSKPLLFNYISFCQFPSPRFIDSIVDMVFKNIESTKYDKRELLEQELYKLYISECKNNEELFWKTSLPLTLFPGAPTFFQELKSLTIDTNYIDSNALYEMAKFCTDLNELSIINYPQDELGFVSLIDAQRNLKRVKLGPFYEKGTHEKLNKALARKGNTIKKLYLCSVNINSSSFYSFLTSLVNLKKLSISNPKYYESQQYHVIPEFPELQYLDVCNFTCYEFYAKLIEKTKGNILRVSFCAAKKYNMNAIKNTGMLIKAIANNCSKIQSLSVHIDKNDFIHVKSLLLNCKNLIGIELMRSRSFFYDDPGDGDELLDMFAKFSPKSLICINLSGIWKYSLYGFEQFFESFRGRNLNSFNISDFRLNYEDHIQIIEKYINEGVLKTSNCTSYRYI